MVEKNSSEKPTKRENSETFANRWYDCRNAKEENHGYYFYTDMH